MNKIMEHFVKISKIKTKDMFCMGCRLCAFISTTITYTDCVHAFMYTTLVYTKKQRTRSVRKYTFTYMKKRARKFSIFNALTVP